LESLRSPHVRDTNNEHEYVSLEEVLRLIAVPHEEDDLALLRDKAATAMLFLSGARASAFTTLPISAVDLPARTLHQWPELGVATKNGKRATTYLLPIPELLSVAQIWDDVSAQTFHRQLPGMLLSPRVGEISHLRSSNQERIATRLWTNAYGNCSI